MGQFQTCRQFGALLYHEQYSVCSQFLDHIFVAVARAIVDENLAHHVWGVHDLNLQIDVLPDSPVEKYQDMAIH
jgi:hypothetical protein